MNKKITFFLFSCVVLILIFKNDVSLSKKKVNIYGQVFECKSPKNSFERTRGVRTRVCILDKKDKKKINEIRNRKKSLRK